MARVQVAADALHLKPTRLRVLSSYKRTSGLGARLSFSTLLSLSLSRFLSSLSIQPLPPTLDSVEVKRRAKTMEKSPLRVYRGRKLRATPPPPLDEWPFVFRDAFIFHRDCFSTPVNATFPHCVAAILALLAGLETGLLLPFFIFVEIIE